MRKVPKSALQYFSPCLPDGSFGRKVLNFPPINTVLYTVQGHTGSPPPPLLNSTFHLEDKLNPVPVGLTALSVCLWCMSVFLSVCLFAFLHCPSVCLFCTVCVFVFLSVFLSLSVWLLSVFLSVVILPFSLCLCIYRSVCVSVGLFVCLCVCIL